jgi:hypothetical protein
MSEQRRFGESDHEPLREDDILAQAIGQWREELPSRDLWPGVQSRLDHLTRDSASSVTNRSLTAGPRQFTFTLSQLAVAASFLIAVVAGTTWLASNRPALTGGGPKQEVIQAYRDSPGTPDQGQIVQANFADAQFNAAVSDLERILREERSRLDPRTVLILERNLKAIDAAINEARMALESDPANSFLNSHLADARRRKLDLLRHATELASTGGD